MQLLARYTFPSGTIGFEAVQLSRGYRLRWNRSATARMTLSGHRVQVQPHPMAKPITIRVIRRLVRAYSASLRGTDPLHATVLSRSSGSVALIGPSGEGKSTLAHHMLQKGWRLVTDDLLYPDLRHGSVRSKPRHAWLKIRPQGTHLDTSDPMYDPNFGKFIVILPPPRTVRPLRAFVRIHRRSSASVQWRRLTPADAALHLTANMYNSLLLPQRVRKRQLSLAASLVRRVPVWSVVYPTGIHQLHRLDAGLVRLMHS